MWFHWFPLLVECFYFWKPRFRKPRFNSRNPNVRLRWNQRKGEGFITKLRKYFIILDAKPSWDTTKKNFSLIILVTTTKEFQLCLCWAKTTPKQCFLSCLSQGKPVSKNFFLIRFSLIRNKRKQKKTFTLDLFQNQAEEKNK